MSSAMNGAVFHTSAMMITISACGSSPSHTVSVPRIEFTNPCGDSKIVRHIVAVTTVRMAHGTSTTVRRSPWPLNAACIASAIARPMSNSRITLDALRIFDLPYVLTKGAHGTTTLSLIAQETFAANRIYGLGAAYSVLTFIVVMIVSFTYIRTVGGNIRGLAED